MAVMRENTFIYHPDACACNFNHCHRNILRHHKTPRKHMEREATWIFRQEEHVLCYKVFFCRFGEHARHMWRVLCNAVR